MDNTNFLKITNSKIELTVSERNTSNLTQPELAAEAILALISFLDVKKFDAADEREKFDICLERITEAIHAIGKWGGRTTMTKSELDGIWNYFLSLEDDLSNTSRYIEPSGQEKVHSFEFAKILILACTEIESVFKAICFEIKKEQVKGDISEYKATILEKYPNVVQASVTVSRLGKDIAPFLNWDTGKLAWWDAYQKVKHNRGTAFNQATYLNAVSAMAALYVLIFYLAEIAGLEFENYKSEYISSQYCNPLMLCAPNKRLPDFEEDT